MPASVRFVVRPGQSRGPADTRQVEGHDVRLRRERDHHPFEGGPALRPAVQQEYRRPIGRSAFHDMQRETVHLDLPVAQGLGCTLGVGHERTLLTSKRNRNGPCRREVSAVARGGPDRGLQSCRGRGWIGDVASGLGCTRDRRTRLDDRCAVRRHPALGRGCAARLHVTVARDPLEAIGEDLQRQYAELANRGQSATDAVAKDSYLRAAEALSGEIEKYLRMRA